ncbi:MAG: Ig-like domain-containing protein [Candidatus Competibacter sp.]|nr:Ig-like domain-containing protein [Candidatus Competibacter sp.]
MTKVTEPLFGFEAWGRIGDIGSFRRGWSCPQFIKAPPAKKKAPTKKTKGLDSEDIRAVDVNATCKKGGSVVIYPASGVITHWKPVTITGIYSASFGYANLAHDAVTYSPAPGFVGKDSIIYTAQDANYRIASAKIRIKVIDDSKDEKGRPLTPKEIYYRQQLAIARKQWAKIKRTRVRYRNEKGEWKYRYYRLPDFKEYWERWLIDHPWQGEE